VPAAALYVFCMLIFPWFSTGFDWQLVQGVWDRWQSLNVGMLAFISSITAFNIGRYNAEKQREREFRASKAFLPSALSELTEYLKESAEIYVSGWEAARGDALKVTAPIPPAGYKEVFRDCIRHAEPDVGEYLSQLLKWLQIHAARLSGYLDQQADDTWSNPDKHNVIVYLYRVGELQAMVNRLFPFSRGLEDLNSGPLVWDELKNAFGNLDLWVEEYRIDDHNNLEAYTMRALERALNGSPSQSA
jgi:hypothetical protein